MQNLRELIEGTYVSKRDGTKYTYEASWVNGERDLAWSARVKRDGVLFSVPTGSMAHVTDEFDPDELVRAVVHRAIEHGYGKV